MALYLISYDIAEKDRNEYQPLWDLLARWRAARVLYSEWVVVDEAPGMAKQMADEIWKILQPQDRLLVQEVTRDAAWANLRVSDDTYIAWLGSCRA